MNKTVKEISRIAATGLWGSVAVVIAIGLFHYISPYRFYQSDYVVRWILIAGAVLAVLAISAALLVIRKQIPSIRQSEASLDSKLQMYKSHIKSLYLSMFGVVAIIGILIVLSEQTVMLMLAMVCTLTLFLAYPNMYRMKVELGLNDDEMRNLYGDNWQPETGNRKLDQQDEQK